MIFSREIVIDNINRRAFTIIFCVLNFLMRKAFNKDNEKHLSAGMITSILW